MGPLDLINHLLNFVAPALAVGGLLAVSGRFLTRTPARRTAFWPQFALNSAIGVAVLLAGLLLLGRDGKMLTYLALVLAAATSQWWASGGWKK